MKHISESIIGKRGVPGPFRSIIIVPIDEDLSICDNLSYMSPFDFGRNDGWFGYVTAWHKDNIMNIYKRITDPDTGIYVSHLDPDKFMEEFIEANKEIESVWKHGSPVKCPESARMMTKEEFKKLIL